MGKKYFNLLLLFLLAASVFILRATYTLESVNAATVRIGSSKNKHRGGKKKKQQKIKILFSHTLFIPLTVKF
jgi:hypothetical protein